VRKRVRNGENGARRISRKGRKGKEEREECRSESCVYYMVT
jgi:hypothetical protein